MDYFDLGHGIDEHLALFGGGQWTERPSDGRRSYIYIPGVEWSWDSRYNSVCDLEYGDGDGFGDGVDSSNNPPWFEEYPDD